MACCEYGVGDVHLTVWQHDSCVEYGHDNTNELMSMPQQTQKLTDVHHRA